MKDFDRAELGAVRSLPEAEFFWKKKQGIAGRPVIYSRYRDRVKATYNKMMMMRKGEEEL